MKAQSHKVSVNRCACINERAHIRTFVYATRKIEARMEFRRSRSTRAVHLRASYFFFFFFSIVTPFDHVYLSTSRESIMYAETYRSIKFFYPFCSNFIHLSILVRQIFDSIIQYRLDAHAPSRFPPSPLISNRKECNILLF